MVDIHTHILPGVDDGLADWEEFRRAASLAAQQGITHIAATPHVTNGEIDVSLIDRLIEQARGQTQTKLLFGAEVNILWAIDKTMNTLKEYTLNKNGRSLLIEFPYSGPILAAREFISRLLDAGFIPVISHAERYHYLTLDEYRWLLAQGACLQVNTGSFLGHYGTQIKNRAHDLLRHDLVSVLASDLHRKDDYRHISEVRQKLNGEVSPMRWEQLANTAPALVLDGKVTEPARG